MESYELSVTPPYAPGDDVIFFAPDRGRESATGRVERLVPIPPLSHQTIRYFYVLHLDDETSVLATDDDLIPAREEP